jgi:hypothetical protein
LRYQAYDINGYTFYTEGHDKKSTYQNSSILVECLNSDEVHKDVYYGTIDEIWELDYVKVKVALFKCRWVPLSQVKVDDYGKTYVNLTKMAYQKDPFILAKTATQIFYVEDPLHKNCHVVMHGKRRVLGIENVADEDDYNECHELPDKGSRTAHTENLKVIKSPKFIRGQPNDPSWHMYMGITKP